MHPGGLHSLLSKLVALTHERDDTALEVALIQALSGLITAIDGNSAKSVVIYHVKDTDKQLFSTTRVDKSPAEIEIPPTLKQTLIDCFKSSELCTYIEDGKPGTKLYPLANSKGQTTGIISVQSQIDDPYLDVAIGMLLQIYKNFTGLINENECDSLTGLLNRKTFEHKISKVFAKMQTSTKRKEDKPNHVYFLAIFDIDHFKKVNDQFGHLIGDEVLLLFSQLMKQTFRDTDPLFRFGGEEFIAVFECNGGDDIKKIIERFRQNIAQFKFPQVGNVTMSSGYTEISAFDTSSLLIDRADTALYYAKNNGRNRTAYYEQLIADGALQDTKKEGDIELF